MNARIQLRISSAALSALAVPAALALVVALAARRADADSARAPAPSAAALNPPTLATGIADGGTVRATGGILVPPSMKDRLRAPPAEPPAPLLDFAAPDLLEALGPFHAEVGAWVEYAVTQKGRRTARVLLTVLPPPMPDGSFWMEIDSIAEGAIPTALRLLVHGDPSRMENLERVIAYVAGQTAFEIPVQALADNKKHAKPLPERTGASIQIAHHTKIKVLAGTFDTDRVRFAKGAERSTVWRSDAVPLYGLVRSESRGRVTELRASGHTGAHSLIATPIPDEGIPASLLNGDANPDAGP